MTCFVRIRELFRYFYILKPMTHIQETLREKAHDTHTRNSTRNSCEKFVRVSYRLAARYLSHEFLASNRACSISCKFLVQVFGASFSCVCHGLYCLTANKRWWLLKLRNEWNEWSVVIQLRSLVSGLLGAPHRCSVVSVLHAGLTGRSMVAWRCRLGLVSRLFHWLLITHLTDGRLTLLWFTVS